MLECKGLSIEPIQQTINLINEEELKIDLEKQYIISPEDAFRVFY